MNLLHLRYFHEVARTRSFTVSSRNLRVSQPAISKMVAQLESSVGKALLERSRQGIKLTPEGELLFDSASRIFAEVREAEARLSSVATELQGEWTIGVSDNIATYLLPKPLGAFKSRHPRLAISVFAATSGQIKEELRHERCQLGVFYTPPKRSEPFECRQILETEFLVVLSARSPWAKRAAKRGLSLDDLRKLGVPRLESRHADYSSGFPAHFHSKKLGLDDPPWLQVNQHEVKKRFVLEGAGYALLTRPSVEAEIKRGELIQVRTPARLPAPIYAVWKKGRALDRVSETFLAEWLKSRPSEDVRAQFASK